MAIQSHWTLCDPLDQSPPGSSVCGILQARILGLVVMSSFKGSSPPRDRTHVSYLLHWQMDSLPLSHLGSPTLLTFLSHKICCFLLLLQGLCATEKFFFPVHLASACTFHFNKALSRESVWTAEYCNYLSITTYSPSLQFSSLRTKPRWLLSQHHRTKQTRMQSQQLVYLHHAPWEAFSSVIRAFQTLVRPQM